MPFHHPSAAHLFDRSCTPNNVNLIAPITCCRHPPYCFQTHKTKESYFKQVMALPTVALFFAVMLPFVKAQPTQDQDQGTDQRCDTSTLERDVQRLQSNVDELRRVLSVHSPVTARLTRCTYSVISCSDTT